MNAHGPEPWMAILPMLIMLFFGLLTTIVIALLYCKIFSKAGYSWALGLLMLVPIANIVMLFVLAFSDWPICNELRLLKQQQNIPPA